MGSSCSPEFSSKINKGFDTKVNDACVQKCFVYVLGINNPEHQIYIGKTNNLQQRMKAHRSGNAGDTGKGEKAQQPTQFNLPVWLIAAIELPVEDAMAAYEGYLQNQQFGLNLPDSDNQDSDWFQWKTNRQAAWDKEAWDERSMLDNTKAVNIDPFKMQDKGINVRNTFVYECSGKRLGIQLIKEKAAQWLDRNPSPAVELELQREKAVMFNPASTRTKMKNPYDNRKWLAVIVPNYFPQHAACVIQRWFRVGAYRKFVVIRAKLVRLSSRLLHVQYLKDQVRWLTIKANPRFRSWFEIATEQQLKTGELRLKYD
jgi:hypothetical protein